MDELYISTAPSRKSKVWRNEKIIWDALCKKCEKTVRTAETTAEYLAMTKDEQSDIKDVGGFVGGYLKDGKRRKGCDYFHSFATLDIDYGTPYFWDDFTLYFRCAAMIYSTHKHTSEKPRIRLVIPFARNVTQREYEPVCRKIAQQIGIELFDHTTYEGNRLFYWPSTSKDGEFVFERQDGDFLDPDKVLAMYHDPFNESEWPRSEREEVVMRKSVEKAEDPTEKNGIVGKFCRAYTIENAIDKFLPDIYDQTAQEGRYTYREGSVAGGLICYDHKFAFSHHETDPAGGRLLNAFDIVRVHKFGSLDEGKNADRVTALPSYERMSEFASDDSEVKKIIFREIKSSAEDDFSGLSADVEAEKEWYTQLETDRKGNIKKTPTNLESIFLNDTELSKIWFDTFRRVDVTDDETFANIGGNEINDESLEKIRIHLYKEYQLDVAANTISRTLEGTRTNRGKNPVKDFIESVVWDGVKRIDTLLIDYLGAEDTTLNRQITRKWFAGAVARVYNPGCKFDYVLTLPGKQGIGKSTFFATIASSWFSNSFSFADNEKTKYEAVNSAWIIEIGELNGLKRIEAEAAKNFLTKTEDRYRPAYAMKTEGFPRHCVFAATTNERNPLTGNDGNRRWWVVPVQGKGEVGDWIDKLKDDVSQIWAEAKHIYDNGEKLYLPPQSEEEIRIRQMDYGSVMEDDLRHIVEDFLNWEIPYNFYGDDMTTEKKRKLFTVADDFEGRPRFGFRRKYVCAPEILDECPDPKIRCASSNKGMLRRLNGILESLDGWELLPDERRVMPGNYSKTSTLGRRVRKLFIRKGCEDDWNLLIDDDDEL